MSDALKGLVSKEQLSEYSKYLTQEIQKLKESLEKKLEKHLVADEVEKKEPACGCTDKQVCYCNYIAESSNPIDYSQYGGWSTETINYSEYMKEHGITKPCCGRSTEEDCGCYGEDGGDDLSEHIISHDPELYEDSEVEDEDDFIGEGEYEIFAVGSFVLVEIATEVFVDASINGYENVDGHIRYDVTTKDGIRVVNLHESRVFDKPAYTEEEFESLY